MPVVRADHSRYVCACWRDFFSIEARPMVCTYEGRRHSDRSAWPRDGALLASTLSIRSYVARGSSGATTPRPNGETIAGCVARAQNSKPPHSRVKTEKKNLEQVHFTFETQRFAIVHSQIATVPLAYFYQTIRCLRTREFATVKSLTFACFWCWPTCLRNRSRKHATVRTSFDTNAARVVGAGVGPWKAAQERLTGLATTAPRVSFCSTAIFPHA